MGSALVRRQRRPLRRRSRTPRPFPGTKAAPFGSSRPGPNLYTDSIVKLNKDTGKLEWHYQLTPHDINDWDLQNSPILTTANGKNVVIDAGKGGIVVAVDQATGKLLWKTPVGIHNGHDHDGLLTLAQAKAKLKPPYKVFPGILGGVESQLASDGTNVYAAVNNLASTYTNLTNAGIKLGDFTKGTGDIVALNQATGKIVWDHKLNQSPYGAASLTNDVLFTTTFDGKLWALSTKTGKALWSAQLPANTNTPVAIAGNTVITAGSFPFGKVRRPRSSRTGSRADEALVARHAQARNARLPARGGRGRERVRGSSGSSPSSSEPTPATTEASTPTTAPATTTAGAGGAVSAAAGKKVFTANCGSCHTLADAATNGNVGPNLDDLKPSMATVVRQVTNGGGGMPAFGSQLSKTQIQSVAKYVSSVAGKSSSSGSGSEGSGLP